MSSVVVALYIESIVRFRRKNLPLYTSRVVVVSTLHVGCVNLKDEALEFLIYDVSVPFVKQLQFQKFLLHVVLGMCDCLKFRNEHDLSKECHPLHNQAPKLCS